MDDRLLMLTLRLIHILGGIFWVGATLVLAGFLLPTLRAVGPDGGRFMQHVMQQRRLQVYLGVAMGLTILSGLGMYWRLSVLSHGALANSRMGVALGVGALSAIVAAVVGAVVSQPAGRKLGALGQRMQQAQAAGERPSPAQLAELQALQTRIARALTAITALLVLSAAAMAMARYL
jgi:uncharacterized membrane protein